MSEYVVLFPADDEAAWLSSTEADREVTYATDAEFGRLLEARGGAITGGAGLAPTGKARTITCGSDGRVTVTDGPHAAGVEQLSGFFIVTCDDYDVLAEVAAVLTRAHPVVEIRPVDEE